MCRRISISGIYDTIFARSGFGVDCKNIHKITISPIFLGQGGHVLRDLPILIEQLKASYPELDLQLATAVGEQESVLLAIRDYCVSLA